jgi:hypothetical protein
MRGERLLAAMSLAVLLSLGGCASNTSSSGVPSKHSAWIVGEPDSCSPSRTVALTIKSVDGTSTVSGSAAFLEKAADPCTFPTWVAVPAGYHTIGVLFTAGSDVVFGAFSLSAEAGRTYDISAHAVGSAYWFEARPRME